MLLLSYSYITNIYLFPLAEVTGNLPVRSVDICLFMLMILMNILLVHCVSVLIGGSSCIIGCC